MNRQIKAKWVAALRSGEYKQLDGHLTDINDSGETLGHCCLGVLCEISKKETGFGIRENLSQTHGDENIGFTVQTWAGLLSTEGAQVTINMKRDFLTAHNDAGRTFLEIADAIEEQL